MAQYDLYVIASLHSGDRPTRECPDVLDRISYPKTGQCLSTSSSLAALRYDHDGTIGVKCERVPHLRSNKRTSTLGYIYGYGMNVLLLSCCSNRCTSRQLLIGARTKIGLSFHIQLSPTHRKVEMPTFFSLRCLHMHMHPRSLSWHKEPKKPYLLLRCLHIDMWGSHQ